MAPEVVQPRRRLLLVEDDASIRRFVSLVLEDEPLELVAAPTLAAAIDALRGPPFDLILCDLMLPDGSGFELLQALGEPGAPSAGARRVAFSAGVAAEARQRLLALGVHEVLAKPVAVAELLACARAATPAPAAEAAGSPPDGPSADEAEQAIAVAFGGDRALYTAFLDACRAQWPQDVACGDRALASADAAVLRRLAHSVKSVLLTLGLPQDAACARRLEDAAEQALPGDARAAARLAPLWQRLRGRLLSLSRPRPC
jgi:CheY-like chemotaxis protein/HPt (histidine-containing phosphotransfer) domain-containing protein